MAKQQDPKQAETDVHPVVVAKAEPSSPQRGDRVMALKEGTYPEPGARVPRFRNKGDVFTLLDAEHFSAEWMRVLQKGDAALLPPPEPEVPQTTAPRNASPANPFPPLG